MRPCRTPRLAVGAAGRKPKTGPAGPTALSWPSSIRAPPTTSSPVERRRHRLNPVLVDDVVGVTEQEEVRLSEGDAPVSSEV